ncbi:hypothetical protein Tco_0494149 [Tanacetum coccineum]
MNIRPPEHHRRHHLRSPEKFSGDFSDQHQICSSLPDLSDPHHHSPSRATPPLPPTPQPRHHNHITITISPPPSFSTSPEKGAFVVGQPPRRAFGVVYDQLGAFGLTAAMHMSAFGCCTYHKGAFGVARQLKGVFGWLPNGTRVRLAGCVATTRAFGCKYNKKGAFDYVPRHLGVSGLLDSKRLRLAFWHREMVRLVVLDSPQGAFGCGLTVEGTVWDSGHSKGYVWLG